MEDLAVQEYKTSAATLAQTAQAMKVKTFEQAMDAADFLLDVKTLGEKVTARKEEITKPLNDFAQIGPGSVQAAAADVRGGRGNGKRRHARLP